jgi:uncharacterized protein
MAVVYVVLGLMFLLNALWLWAADVLLRQGEAGRWLRWASAGFVVLMLAGLGWLLINRRLQAHLPPPTLAMALLMLWHMLLLPLSLVLLAMAASVRGALSLPDLWRQRTPVAAASTLADDARGRGTDTGGPVLARRQFLCTTAAMLPPLVTLGATGWSIPQLSGFRIRRFDLILADLPPALEGLSIAHVADVHVGRFTQGRVLRQIVEATNQINAGKPADLVLLTGDLINDSNRDLPAAIEMVRAMKSRHGVYLCEGNHDLIDDGARFNSEVLLADLPLLRNDVADVEVNGQHVQVMGLLWGPPGRLPGQRTRSSESDIAASMAATIQLRNPQAFPILLAHHPHAFDYASAAGVPLTLAGHTHGGQLHLSDDLGFGPWMYRYWSGVYRDGDAACVVSNGVGNWFPLRTNAPAEIIHITLRQRGVGTIV